MERLEREKKSPIIELLKWKCAPFQPKDLLDPNNTQYRCCSFNYESSGDLRFINGISQIDDSHVIAFWKNHIILVDVKNRELLRVDNVDLHRAEHHKTLDLAKDGSRWVGDVLNGVPYGWGVLYDRDSMMMYEGFRVDDTNVCYGRKFHSGLSKIEYEGEWCQGKRWGRGIEYNTDDSIAYEGEWMDDTYSFDKSVEISSDSTLLHTCVEELTVNNDCCNGEKWSELSMDLMPQVKSLSIGSGCFSNVERVELNGLKGLESVVIGGNCFTAKEGHFCLKDCPVLTQLSIGSNSFPHYTVMEIECLPLLKEVVFGDSAFQATSHLPVESGFLSVFSL